jgi:hypothetical protein
MKNSEVLQKFINLDKIHNNLSGMNPGIYGCSEMIKASINELSRMTESELEKQFNLDDFFSKESQQSKIIAQDGSTYYSDNRIMIRARVVYDIPKYIKRIGQNLSNWAVYEKPDLSDYVSYIKRLKDSVDLIRSLEGLDAVLYKPEPDGFKPPEAPSISEMAESLERVITDSQAMCEQVMAEKAAPSVEISTAEEIRVETEKKAKEDRAASAKPEYDPDNLSSLISFLHKNSILLHGQNDKSDTRADDGIRAGAGSGVGAHVRAVEKSRVKKLERSHP